MDKKLTLTILKIETMASVRFNLPDHQFIIDLITLDEFFPHKGISAVDLEFAQDGELNGFLT